MYFAFKPFSYFHFFKGKKIRKPLSFLKSYLNFRNGISSQLLFIINSQLYNDCSCKLRLSGHWGLSEVISANNVCESKTRKGFEGNGTMSR